MIEIFDLPAIVILRGASGDPLGARLIEACIGTCGRVSYKAVWWIGHDRKEQWVDASEIVKGEHGTKTQKIGFIPQL